MPIYEYRCEECLKVEELWLPMDQRNNARICDCGGREHRLISLPYPPIMVQGGRDKVLKTLNKEDGYTLPGGNDHRERYEQALSQGLERHGQPGKYRSGIGS